MALVCSLVLAVLLGVTLFLTAEKRIAGEWGFSLDDSWIHATIARNLATGHGYSFNPGESVGGSTSPLFTLLLALVYRVIGNMVWSAKLLGIVFQCATAIVVFKTMAILNPNWRGPRIVAGLAAGLSPNLLWASLSGMEISFYLFVVALGFYYYVAGRLLAATFVWSLGIWIRPDGAFLALLGVVSSRRHMLRRLAVTLLIAVAYISFNYAVGHQFLPQSVGAKTTLTLDVVPRLARVLREWAVLWGLGGHSPWPLGLPLLLLVLGAAATYRRVPLLSLYCIGFPVVWAIFAGSTGVGSRYVLCVIAPGMALVVAGAASITNKLSRPARNLARVALAASLLSWEVLGGFATAEAHAWNVQNINGMHRRLGEAAKRMTQPGDVLAVNDIGAIGYFSERYIVDLMGLISPRRSLPENLSFYKPRLLIIFPNWFQGYTVYDSLGDNTYYFDADSTHKYSALFLVELRHNTVAARERMCVFVRQNAKDPPPQRRWKYVH